MKPGAHLAFLVAVVLVSAFTAVAQPVPIRILPLGDSITLGFNVPGGYRAPLYQLLTNAGYTVDFLGTQTGFGAPLLPDPDHEGYGGYRIEQIDSLILNTFNAIADPDVILLLIGSSDYAQGFDTAHATNRLEALIAKMATNRPGAKIIVANLLPRKDAPETGIQATFNPFVPGVCDRQYALGRQVFFNDLRSAVTVADIADSVHPNQPGYNKLATNWFTAIKAVTCTNCPPRFTLQPANQIVLPGTNVTLAATAIGTGGAIHYQWRFEGTDILNATNATYSFTNASLTNGHGNFSVVASDDNGTSTSTDALIFVRISPGIVTPPISQTVIQGGTAIFTCVAAGAPPILYRWQSNGVFFATNTTGILVFTNVQKSMSIRAVAMNTAGSANSATVTLTVLNDFDRDGMPDLWEIQYGFNTNNTADALLDFDDDGMINRDEYVAGTNPTNASSVLRILLTPTNNGVLQFVAQTNLGYTVQYRTNLETASWSILTNITSSSQVRTVLVNTPNPPPDLKRFYRVITPPAP